MLFRPEVSIAPVDQKWYSKHGDKGAYADRSRALRETLPNAQEFVVALRRENFVPVRHLIVQAMLQLQEDDTSLYAGTEGASLARLGRFDDSADEEDSVFAHSLDHLDTREALSKPMPDLRLDPFILFHLAGTQQPAVLRYDTTKLQSSGDNQTNWKPVEGETAASAVDGVFYLRPGKR